MQYETGKRGLTKDMSQSPDYTENLILATLPQAERESIAVFMEEMPLAQGKILQDAQARAHYIYFLVGGLVSLTTPTGGGEDVETAVVGAEGIVNAVLALGVLAVPCRATVRVCGRAFRLPANHLKPLMEINKAFAAVMLRYLANGMFETAQNVACSSRHTIPQRVARRLLTSHDRLGTATIICTHEFLSQALGVRRAGVTVELGTLESLGIVQQNRGSLLVKDRARLEARSCDCYRLSRLSYERVMG